MQFSSFISYCAVSMAVFLSSVEAGEKSHFLQDNGMPVFKGTCTFRKGSDPNGVCEFKMRVNGVTTDAFNACDPGARKCARESGDCWIEHGTKADANMIVDCSGKPYVSSKGKGGK